MPHPKIPILERLVAYTRFTTGCWECNLAPNTGGYPLITEEIDGEQVSYTVHRYVWQLVYGPVPEGLVIAHRCDNRSCWRPSHLFAITSRDNTADRHEKGRDARGEGHGRALLTADQVREIRVRYAAGGTGYDALAAEFGVTRWNIRAIVKGWTWRHLLDPDSSLVGPG